MLEDVTKYNAEDAPRVETLPMVDAAVVLFAGRTMLDVATPIVSGVMSLVLLDSFWLAVGVPPVLFFSQPWLRAQLGRGRVLHLAWAFGLVRAKGLPVVFSLRGGTETFGP